MKISEIIAAIQKSEIENAEQVAQSLTEHLEALQEESKSKTDKLATQINTLTSVFGIESGSNEEKLTAAKTLVANLQAERDGLKNEKESLETKVARIEKSALIKSAAETSKASAAVLETLIRDEEIVINDGKVSIDGKSLEDWATQYKPAFMPALYPNINNSKLPGTPPQVKEKQPEQPEEKSVVDKYMEKNYDVPSFLKK